MAPAVGKTESVSLFLFLEVNSLVVGEELFMGHACLGGRCIVGKMEKRAAEGLEEADSHVLAS